MIPNLTKLFLSVGTYQVVSSLANAISDEITFYLDEPRVRRKKAKIRRGKIQDLYHLVICDNCKTTEKFTTKPKEIHCVKCGCVDNIRYDTISKKLYDLMNRQGWKKPR